jgi:hypothetical protein
MLPEQNSEPPTVTRSPRDWAGRAIATSPGTSGDAWPEETEVLLRVLARYAGAIYLEFAAPRMGRRNDALVIMGPVIFGLELPRRGKRVSCPRTLTRSSTTPGTLHDLQGSSANRVSRAGGTPCSRWIGATRDVELHRALLGLTMPSTVAGVGADLTGQREWSGRSPGGSGRAAHQPARRPRGQDLGRGGQAGAGRPVPEVVERVGVDEKAIAERHRALRIVAESGASTT